MQDVPVEPSIVPQELSFGDVSLRVEDLKGEEEGELMLPPTNADLMQQGRAAVMMLKKKFREKQAHKQLVSDLFAAKRQRNLSDPSLLVKGDKIKSNKRGEVVNRPAWGASKAVAKAPVAKRKTLKTMIYADLFAKYLGQYFLKVLRLQTAIAQLKGRCAGQCFANAVPMHHICFSRWRGVIEQGRKVRWLQTQRRRDEKFRVFWMWRQRYKKAAALREKEQTADLYYLVRLGKACIYKWRTDALGERVVQITEGLAELGAQKRYFAQWVNRYSRRLHIKEDAFSRMGGGLSPPPTYHSDACSSLAQHLRGEEAEGASERLHDLLQESLSALDTLKRRSPYTKLTNSVMQKLCLFDLQGASLRVFRGEQQMQEEEQYQEEEIAHREHSPFPPFPMQTSVFVGVSPSPSPSASASASASVSRGIVSPVAALPDAYESFLSEHVESNVPPPEVSPSLQRAREARARMLGSPQSVSQESQMRGSVARCGSPDSDTLQTVVMLGGIEYIVNNGRLSASASLNSPASSKERESLPASLAATSPCVVLPRLSVETSDSVPVFEWPNPSPSEREKSVAELDGVGAQETHPELLLMKKRIDLLAREVRFFSVALTEGAPQAVAVAHLKRLPVERALAGVLRVAKTRRIFLAWRLRLARRRLSEEAARYHAAKRLSTALATMTTTFRRRSAQHISSAKEVAQTRSAVAMDVRRLQTTALLVWQHAFCAARRRRLRGLRQAWRCLVAYTIRQGALRKALCTVGVSDRSAASLPKGRDRIDVLHYSLRRWRRMAAQSAAHWRSLGRRETRVLSKSFHRWRLQVQYSEMLREQKRILLREEHKSIALMVKREVLSAWHGHVRFAVRDAPDTIYSYNLLKNCLRVWRRKAQHKPHTPPRKAKPPKRAPEHNLNDSSFVSTLLTSYGDLSQLHSFSHTEESTAPQVSVEALKRREYTSVLDESRKGVAVDQWQESVVVPGFARLQETAERRKRVLSDIQIPSSISGKQTSTASPRSRKHVSPGTERGSLHKRMYDVAKQVNKTLKKELEEASSIEARMDMLAYTYGAQAVKKMR